MSVGVCVWGGGGGWLAGWVGGQAGSRWAGVHAYACVCVIGYYIFYSTLSELGSVLNFHSCVRKFPT